MTRSRPPGGAAQSYQADAASADASAALVRRVVQDHGGLDILVNNAGTYIVAPVQDLSDDDYDATFDTNLRGPFAAIREAARHLRDNGRIINVGSTNGKMGFPGNAAYGVSKAAVNMLTRSVAKELGGRGITVNTVNPGPTDTQMNPADPDQNPYAAMQIGMTALGRFGTPDEVASAIAYFASDEASFVTGAELTVDGGVTA